MVAIANSVSSNYVVSAGGGGFDPNAEAFITAAGITNPTEQNAINELVLDLKAASIWTKFNALYPIVGGTATTHKYNLKNPLDTDAAFRLSFSTGWTHSSTGMTPNGTSAYANTNFNVNLLQQNSSHFSYYSRTNAQSGHDAGAIEIGTPFYKRFEFLLRYTDNNSYNSLMMQSAQTAVTVTDSRAFWLMSRTNSTQIKQYKNNTLWATNNQTSVAPFNALIYLGQSNGQTGFYSNKEVAFSSIGDGLTDTESQVFYQIVEKYQLALGRNINPTQSFYYNRNYNNETNAFLFATQITDTTQQTAVNTLVNDFKSAGIWTKMRAVYPIVGGTATTHKFNLVNPQDTDAAYRLSFSTGWTHSSTGMLPNGTNAYADTFLIPSSTFSSVNSQGFSFYSRTSLTFVNSPNHGAIPATTNDRMYFAPQATYYQVQGTENASFWVTFTNTDRKGMYTSVRTSATSRKTYKNGNLAGSSTGNDTGGALTSLKFYIGAANGPSLGSTYTKDELAFSALHDGLTDLESQVFNQIVEGYQFTLGRNINPSQSFYYNTAYNNETNAYLYSTQITDTTIQTATNTLVNDLKTAGVWTKMRAVYPIVGGTATTHKFNLVNPQDTDAAYRLSFSTGWTHSSTGMLPNGTSAFANTFLATSVIGLNTGHLSFYSRTNSLSASSKASMGSLKSTPNSYSDLGFGSLNQDYFRWNNSGTYDNIAATNTLGFYNGSRTAGGTIKLFKNGTAIINGVAASSATSAISFYISASNNNGVTQFYDNKECAFASIGDGLNDTEAANFYTAVQNFQTTLNRQV